LWNNPRRLREADLTSSQNSAVGKLEQGRQERYSEHLSEITEVTMRKGKGRADDHKREQGLGEGGYRPMAIPEHSVGAKGKGQLGGGRQGRKNQKFRQGDL